MKIMTYRGCCVLRLALADRLREVQKASNEELTTRLAELVGLGGPVMPKTVVGHP